MKKIILTFIRSDNGVVKDFTNWQIQRQRKLILFLGENPNWSEVDDACIPISEENSYDFFLLLMIKTKT